MTKHTPGPWIAEKRESNAIVIRAEGRKPVAEIWHNGDDPTANGDLVAAAPDLLIAAKDAAVTLANMVEAVRGKAKNSPCIMRLMAAIAKAEGRS